MIVCAPIKVICLTVRQFKFIDPFYVITCTCSHTKKCEYSYYSCALAPAVQIIVCTPILCANGNPSCIRLVWAGTKKNNFHFGAGPLKYLSDLSLKQGQGEEQSIRAHLVQWGPIPTEILCFFRNWMQPILLHAAQWTSVYLQIAPKRCFIWHKIGLIQFLWAGANKKKF